MRLLLFLWCTLLGGYVLGAAETGEWLSDELNCALTLPIGADWTTLTPPSPAVKAVAQTRDGSSSVILVVTPLPDKSTKLDDKFIKGFDGGYFPPGKSKKLSGVQLVIRGVPAYKSAGELYIGEKIVRRSMTLWIADGKVYQLTAMKLGADPTEDAAIRACLSSFRFLKQPTD